MDEQTHPFEPGLDAQVHFEPPGREFIGRATLQGIRERGSDAVLSPTLARSIGLARVVRPPFVRHGRALVQV